MGTLQTLAQLWVILAKLISMDSQSDTINFMEQIHMYSVSSKEIKEAEQSDRTLFCCNSKGLQ